MKKVLIYTTGGTIEKSYCEFDGSLSNRESLLKEKLLKKIRLPHTEIEVTEVLHKDSLAMRRADREFIWRRVESDLVLGHPILILHGTDTMVETATLFHETCPVPPVPIIFTGAMRPMGFEDTDATQNVIEALMASHLVQPGIYISFHGELFPLPNVKKDRDLGTFVRTKSE
ncbi:MAG: asparaginase [Bdellovibrionales bacterium]|nr:asparaginase [Bdellovibrionales bacterium]